MSAPDYTIEPGVDVGFVVKIGGHVAGIVAEDGEFPGLWEIWILDGTLMGRTGSKETAAAFLAALFIADGDSQA